VTAGHGRAPRPAGQDTNRTGPGLGLDPRLDPRKPRTIGGAVAVVAGCPSTAAIGVRLSQWRHSAGAARQVG
jgi:hypothetical protein